MKSVFYRLPEGPWDFEILQTIPGLNPMTNIKDYELACDWLKHEKKIEVENWLLIQIFALFDSYFRPLNKHR